MPHPTRRALVGSAAAAPFALTSLMTARAHASAPSAGKQVPGIYRYKVGDFELTAINDGVGVRPLDDGFVRNAPLGDVQAALQQVFLPTDKLAIPYTQLLVNTGRRLVLIDTGTGGHQSATSGMLVENLEAAGIDAQAVDAVVISHFHGDHILGLQNKEGKPTFPNAEVMVPSGEWAFWMDEGEMSRAPEGRQAAFKAARKIFEPIARDVKHFEADTEIIPGITALPAYGHTPGHVIFRIASGGDHIYALSDTTNLPALFVRNPGWHATFDMDAKMAEETRRRVLDMVASERARVQGYHFPFPATGHIAKRGEGYEFVPAFWNPML